MSKLSAVASAIASVTVRRSRTVNLGNYESETIDLSVTVPVFGEYQDVYDASIEFVEQQLDNEVAKLGGKSINKVASKRIEKETASKKTVDEEAADDVKADEKPEAKETAGEKVKQQDVRAALKSVKDDISNDAYKGILGEFDVKSFGALSEDDYAAVLEKCNEVQAQYKAEQEKPDDAADDLDDDLGGDDDLGEDEVTVTLEEVKAALRQYNEDNGKGAHKGILAKFDCTSITQVKESDYVSVMAELV